MCNIVSRSGKIQTHSVGDQHRYARVGQVRSGYILVTAVSIIMLVTVMATAVLMVSQSAARFEATQARRTQAQILVYSGIATAQALLASRPPQNEIDEKDQMAVALQTYANFLVHGNAWRRLTHIPAEEGMVDILITCQEGKLPLREFIDKEKGILIKQPERQAEVALEQLGEKIPLLKEIDLSKRITRWLEGGRCAILIDDLMQLLASDQRRFLYPRMPEEGSAPRASLEDIFTLAADTCSILFFSPSLWKSIGYSGALLSEDAQQAVVTGYQKLSGNEQNEVKTVWKKVIEPVFKVSYDAIPPALQPFLSTSLEARIFAVCVRAQVGEIVTYAWAEFEKSSTFDNSNREYVIKKLRWLS